MSINRYDDNPYLTIGKGRYVLYDDHVRDVEAAKADMVKEAAGDAIIVNGWMEDTTHPEYEGRGDWVRAEDLPAIVAKAAADGARKERARVLELIGPQDLGGCGCDSCAECAMRNLAERIAEDKS